MSERSVWTTLPLLGVLVFGARFGVAQDPGQLPPESNQSSPETPPATPEPETSLDAPLVWLSDFEAAQSLAENQKKMLLVVFESEHPKAAQKAFLQKTVSNGEIKAKLRDFVLVKVPVNYEVTRDDESIRLIRRPGFKHLYGKAGLAILDYKTDNKPHSKHVVSAYTFDNSTYTGVKSMRTILDLPSGSLTQRTLVWAVRMHGERPRSTSGRFHPVLFHAAEKHSQHQARIRLQGHHNWDSRFHQISAKLERHGGPIEVCAESWPGETLVPAAIECVHSWRQSSGHWSAVRGRHAVYGYDMKRGSNGIWYATGVFAN